MIERIDHDLDLDRGGRWDLYFFLSVCADPAQTLLERSDQGMTL